MKKDYSLKNIKRLVFSKAKKNGETLDKHPYIWLLRWISIPFVKLLLYTPITANQITLIGVLFVVFSVIPFSEGSLIYGFVGVLFLFLGQFGDALDGPVARCKKQLSELPCHYLTHFYHQGAVSFIFVGIGLGVFRNTSALIYLYAGFMAGFFHLLTVYIFELRTALLLEYDHNKFKKVHDGSKIFIQSKFQRFVLNIFVFPVIHIKGIILLSYLFGVVDWLILFFGLFLPLRALLFFYNNYWNLKKFEVKT